MKFEQENGMCKGLMEWLQKMEWVLEVGIGTGKWNGYRILNRYKKLEWAQENGMETGKWNKYMNSNGYRKWNGYR